MGKQAESLTVIPCPQQYPSIEHIILEYLGWKEKWEA